VTTWTPGELISNLESSMISKKLSFVEDEPMNDRVWCSKPEGSYEQIMLVSSRQLPGSYVSECLCTYEARHRRHCQGP
jgi:hypothetical protein